MSDLSLPQDPVELAALQAQSTLSDGFEMLNRDEHLIGELEHAAKTLGFLNKSYFVESGRAMILPVSLEPTEPVTYTSFFGLTFEGSFATYSKVHIGRLVGAGSIRAVCMAFDNVTLLPYFNEIPEDSLLHVPVLAIDNIAEMAA